MTFPNLDLVNSAFVFPVDPGTPFQVTEYNAGGEGICTFNSTSPILVIRAKNQSPVVWAVKNRKCAEAAFISLKPDGSTSMHILEMKSRLTLGEFQKVIKQWRGMYLSALATIGILRIPTPDRVTVYVACKRDDVEVIDPAQPIAMKVMVGGGQIEGLREWRSKSVAMHHGLTAKIVVGIRSPQDFDFGTIQS